MRRAIIVCAVGSLLFGMLLVGPLAWGDGGAAKRTEIWWQEGSGGDIYKAVFQTTGSGIVMEWRYEPDHSLRIFKPRSKFRQPGEGGYVPWTYDRWRYTLQVPGSPSQKTLDDIFTEPPKESYWYKCTMQD